MSDAAPDSVPPFPALPARPPLRVAWPWALCVVGLDYLSSLAYQPSVAFAAAGNLAPVVTVGVVLVTLLLAVPLYWYLAGRSPHGLGSVGLLERVVPGWRGKFLVVVLLGFAATDLIFTRTYSAADAAEHLVHSPAAPWQEALGTVCAEGDRLAADLPPEAAPHAHQVIDRRVFVTFLLLVGGTAVGFVFRRGVTRGLIGAAVLATGLYAVATAVVVGSGVVYLAQHPELVEAWWGTVRGGQWKPDAEPWPVDWWWPFVAACVLLFPQLALGLSGFEMGLTAMPLVRGAKSDTHERPRGRVRNTRLLLVTIAGLMSVLLLASTLVTTVLVPRDALLTDGRAANRALAYVAHGGELTGGIPPADVNPLFGVGFGSAYDALTVLVLTLAGVTVLIGLRDLIPPYLYRLGMDWKWSRRLGLLLYLFTFLKLGVTFFYHADPDAQRGAYLTGVLSLFAGAAGTAVLDLWQRRRGRWWAVPLTGLFGVALAVFAGSAVVAVTTQPAGLYMAGWFVGFTLLVSMVTRFFRSTELRFTGFEFADEQSRHLWEDLILQDYPVIVPHHAGASSLAEKERDVRQFHRVPPHLAVVFLEVEVGDASDFYHRPRLAVVREEGRVVARVTRAASVPHVVAAAALEVAKEGLVPEVHFGWSAENPLTANLNFVLFGQGNVPWMVYELIQAADFPAARKPRVMVG